MRRQKQNVEPEPRTVFVFPRRIAAKRNRLWISFAVTVEAGLGQVHLSDDERDNTTRSERGT